ncbi:hypothetical protein K504DRAFT_350411, partial [Pleomassaria siparia CBS 279.74]
MLARPIVQDGLWRCLCPIFPSAQKVFSKATIRDRRLRAASFKPQFRAFNGAPEPSIDPSIDPSSSKTPYLSPAGFGVHGRHLPRDSLTPSSQTPALHLLSTADLYERLRKEGAAGKYDHVQNLLQILVKDRREKPNAQMYAAVLHSFCDSHHGTAGKVRKVLDEMKEMGIELDGRGCHCVLEALAVHPDYLLRAEVLEYMRERWYNLTDRGHNMVVAGYLRERNFEQALEKIADMISKRVVVEPWLWDKTMWLLLDYGEIEEAYQTLLTRQSYGAGKLSNALWSYFMDCAASVHNYDAVNTIWQSQVIPGYVKIGTAACLNILTLAGRKGDVKLATDVFRVLSDRDNLFDVHTYEGLMEAYLTASDLSSALSVVIIMHESGLKVTSDNLSPIYFFMTMGPDYTRPMEAFKLLQMFESQGRKIPVAAVNSCLQASVHLENLEEAIEIYKVLHTVVKTGPNTATFNILLQGCHKAGRKELAMFLASEMTQLGLQPDKLTYDRLAITCMYVGDLQDAMLYYEEMTSQNFVMRRGTFDFLIRMGVKEGDSRTPAVLRHMIEAGFTPHPELVNSVKERFE